jgi:hypothetical protein
MLYIYIYTETPAEIFVYYIGFHSELFQEDITIIFLTKILTRRLMSRAYMLISSSFHHTSPNAKGS